MLVLALLVSDRQIEKEFVQKKSIFRETEVICEVQHCDLFAGLFKVKLNRAVTQKGDLVIAVIPELTLTKFTLECAHTNRHICHFNRDCIDLHFFYEDSPSIPNTSINLAFTITLINTALK